MTDIIRAKNSGFCFWSKTSHRKQKSKLKKIKTAEGYYTFGPLILNRLVTDGLRG